MQYWQTGFAALRIEEAGLLKLIEGFRPTWRRTSTTVALVLETKGRTIVSGIEKSGHIGRVSHRRPAQFISAGEASHVATSVASQHQISSS